MKATLEFDLSDPDERQAHLRCVKSLDLAIALHEFLQDLRSCIKHSESEVVTAYAATWQAKLIGRLEEKNVDLDELIS